MYKWTDSIAYERGERGDEGSASGLGEVSRQWRSAGTRGYGGVQVGGGGLCGWAKRAIASILNV